LTAVTLNSTCATSHSFWLQNQREREEREKGGRERDPEGESEKGRGGQREKKRRRARTSERERDSHTSEMQGNTQAPFFTATTDTHLVGRDELRLHASSPGRSLL